MWEICWRTKGTQEQTVQLGFEGYRHVNAFDNPVSHLFLEEASATSAEFAAIEKYPEP